MTNLQSTSGAAIPILLFDGECGVCRHIGRWVQTSAKQGGINTLFARTIGNDPRDLRALNPALDIWDAYANIHVLMPDGTMKLGGEAVAEVLRDLPNTRWFAGCFELKVFGHRPFQSVLNLAYIVLSDIRPIFGCESCVAQKSWVKPITRFVRYVKNGLPRGQKAMSSNHSTPKLATKKLH